MMHNTGIKSGSVETVTGALSVSGPQPVWMTLDEARERAFTGEIVFEVDPEVLAYLDNGVVYYAERSSDPSLGRRLLEAGVIETDQLERGTVRVGDVEHLGRLFDRDDSVDRDAVLVVTETATENLIAELANRAVSTVRVTAYRHHPSGVHRWFVAQVDAHAPARVAHSVGQLDSMVAERRGPSMVSDVTDGELTIEWDELSDPMSATLSPTDGLDVLMFDPFRDGELPAGAEMVDAEMVDAEMVDAEMVDAEMVDAEMVDAEMVDADMVAVEDVAEMVEVVAIEDDLADLDFQMTWPDGTEESVVADGSGPVVPQAPAFTEVNTGELRFEMPALELSDDDAGADEVPDDVAAAVRRAIAAIEMVSGEVPMITPMEVDSAPESPDSSDMGNFDMGTFEPATFDPATFESTTFEPATVEPATVEPADVVVAQVEAAPSAFAGFAPPTMDMSAEVMYAQVEAAAIAHADVAVEIPQPSLASTGVASVVFVDDEPSGGSGDERSSALRRLIGSLRRKDH
jgi:hypothetical protein